MNCKFCSKDLPEGARFCQSCGARAEPQRVMPSEVPSAPRWQAQALEVERATYGTLGRGVGPAVSVASQESGAGDDDALYIDPLHIIYMSIISGGLYSLYWLFLTWKQLHAKRDRTITPFGTLSRCTYRFAGYFGRTNMWRSSAIFRSGPDSAPTWCPSYSYSSLASALV